MVPSRMLPACLGDAGSNPSPMPGRNPLEREAWLLALMLHRLLHLAPPDELIALSRDPIA